MAEDSSYRKDISAQTRPEGYRRDIIARSFEIRVLGVLIAMLCTMILKNVFKVNVQDATVYVFWVWLVTSSIYLYILRINKPLSGTFIENTHFSYYFFAVTYATLIAHNLGGAEWIAFFVYLFDLIYANALMERKKGIAVTGLVYFSYLALIWMEYTGVIPHNRVMPIYRSVYNDTLYVIGTNVIFVGMVYFVVSCASGLFCRIGKDRERMLVDVRNGALRTAAKLEEVNGHLARQIEENKRLKKAAGDHIGRKESELDSVKKDLEDHIERLRKTQRSMRLMISDMNNMSRELKNSKDTLEEKVRQRTDELVSISSKLHRSERLAFLGKLAGSVTHELKNPMAVLKNVAYFLEGKLKMHEDEKVRSYIDIMKKQISAIDSIVEDIMGFARTKPVRLKKEDLSLIIEDAIALLNVPELIEIVKEFGEAPYVLVDRGQVIHAIVNIANNAIVAMNGNGKLVLRTGLRDNRVCLDIIDAGPGIPEELRETVFEPLYSSKPKGTGLGLPIAKMMIEAQGGKIHIAEASGEGTTFVISFPLKPEPAIAKSARNAG